MRPKITGLSFLAFLVVTALFRATQNAMQTSFAPFGHDILRLSPSIAGLGVTIAGLVTAGANLFLVSRLQSRHLHQLALVGLASLSLGITVIVLGSNLPTYLGSAVILGLAGGLVRPVLATLAGQIRGVSRDRALAAYTVALSASLAVGPFFESILLSFNGNSLRTALLTFVPLPIVAGALLIIVLPNSQPSPKSNQEASFSSRIKENAPLRLAIVAQLLYQIPFVAVTTFGALVAHALYGASPATAQLSFTIFFLLSFFTRSLLVWKPLGNRGTFVLRISALLTLTGVFGLGVGHNIIFLMTSMALLGIPHGLVFPLSISLIARGTTSEDLPKANATLFAATSVVSVISPILLGLVTTHAGYHTMLILVLVPVVVLTGVLFRLNPITVQRDPVI